ncbi:MAG: STAS domain-containing protein [Proteobacteria bacterium]|nr:STAS domain-containing protein [Pseudomonadota bacterium]MBU1737243.1 STAS domain-containing protein [Pseudomonadota bacterium]
MKLTIEPDGRRGTLVLRGAQTIGQAHALKESLLDAFQKVEELEIDMDAITEADLSLLQLLCAAHRTSQELRKKLFIKRRWPEVLEKTAGSAGFFQHRRCQFNLENDCLWRKEGGE